MSQKKQIKVIELFAGVGGFRLGLEGDRDGNSSTSNYKRPLENKIPFHIRYSNQLEPKKKKQYASDIYQNKFQHAKNSKHYEKDIYLITPADLKVKCDLLAGGFPCQNYSVASLLRDATGLIGEKGVLWWEIEKILTFLDDSDKSPDYLLLENVDKLLISPTSRPGEPNFAGKDFAIILSSLAKLNYNVEWRIINAADYGFPQKRKRVFIFGFKESSKVEKKKQKYTLDEILLKHGIIAQSFLCEPKDANIKLPGIQSAHRSISKDKRKYMKSYLDGKFKNAGVMINGKVIEYDMKAIKEPKSTLGSILVPKAQVPEEFYVRDKEVIEKWKNEKSSHQKLRKPKKGPEYFWKVGNMKFPDPLDEPSRTIVTSEGSKSPSRISHIIKDRSGDYRRLTPAELELLNMFPKNFTKMDGVPNSTRAFLMGNALVVGIVEKIGTTLSEVLSNQSL